MSFHNVRLPDTVERGATGGPAFNTTILVLSSGYEQRNQNWERSRGRWEIAYGPDAATQQTILAFFYARRGRAFGFRFKDWSDYQILGPQEIGTGDDTTTQFQVFKRYTDTGGTFDRSVTRLVDTTVQVYLNSVLQVSGFTIDNNTGVITFLTAPANGVNVAVACEFDVPVRFDTDELQVETSRPDVVRFDGIQLVELRERLQTLS